MNTNRRVLGEILYGSQNYGLNGPNSDKDYYEIVMPSFYDLYYQKEASDKKSWDIRKFTKLILDGNFNAIELLFSVDKQFYSQDFEFLWHYLRAISSDIVARRSKKFYYSIRGCFKASLDNADKADSVETYIKHMARTQYFVDLLDHVRLSHFYLTENAWRGNFTENARNIRFNHAPVDKEKLLADMDRLSIYYDRTENLPSKYYEMITSNFQDLMEEKDDDD
jgi:hypothetical protein